MGDGIPPSRGTRFTDGGFGQSIQDETVIEPTGWRSPSLPTDIRQPIARIKASPFVPHEYSIRGFVLDVAAGKLDEVT